MTSRRVLAHNPEVAGNSAPGTTSPQAASRPLLEAVQVGPPADLGSTLTCKPPQAIASRIWSVKGLETDAMKGVLVLAAVSEAVTGIALLIVPSLVGQLLLGAELAGIAVPVARVTGIALIALGSRAGRARHWLAC
jgi:hypothetical protein